MRNKSLLGGRFRAGPYSLTHARYMRRGETSDLYLALYSEVVDVNEVLCVKASCRLPLRTGYMKIASLVNLIRAGQWAEHFLTRLYSRPA